ncbi:hypothetical protein B0H12DRAFT_1242263 [Mycena haematopus]|nr:hypothetical protein B0H12DRAFT_1242263 [Mycena haematopus]
MVILEILSELEPYHHLPTEFGVFKHILQGGRPIRTHLDHQVVTKQIWNFLTLLWDQEPSSRPVMSDVVANLTTIEYCEPPSPAASSGSDLEEKMSSGEETSFETAPVDFHGRDLTGRIKQVDQYPFAGGGNSNIYRGTRSDGRKIRVAIK